MKYWHMLQRGEHWKYCISDRSQTKVKCCMIPLTWTIQNRYIHTERKISDCRRPQWGRNGYGMSFGGNENVLELQWSDSCATFWMWVMPLNCTFLNDFYAIWISPEIFFEKGRLQVCGRYYQCLLIPLSVPRSFCVPVTLHLGRTRWLF